MNLEERWRCLICGKFTDGSNGDLCDRCILIAEREAQEQIEAEERL